MKRFRSNCLLCSFFLLAVMIGLLVGIVRWEDRQARLDQALLLALRDEGDKTVSTKEKEDAVKEDAVKTALERGADPYAIVFYYDDDNQVNASCWQRLRDLWNERIHGESRTDATGRPALAAAFRLCLTPWRGIIKRSLAFCAKQA